MIRLRRAGLAGLLFHAAIWTVSAADGASVPTAWNSLNLTGPVAACPEILADLMPEGMTIECAPYDGVRKPMMLEVDRWLRTLDENTEARGGWNGWKVGQGRLEPVSGSRWTAWWIPKNEHFVVRMTRHIDSPACEAKLRSEGFAAPRSAVGGEPLKVDYRLPSERPNGFPEAARKVRRGGITAHRIRVAEDGSVVAVCPILEVPSDLGFESESRRALKVTRFERKVDSGPGSELPAERIIVRTYTIGEAPITALLWKVFIKPEKFLLAADGTD